MLSGGPMARLVIRLYSFPVNLKGLLINTYTSSIMPCLGSIDHGVVSHFVRRDMEVTRLILRTH